MKLNAVVDLAGNYLYDAAPGYTVEPNTREVPPMDPPGLLAPRYTDARGWHESATDEQRAERDRTGTAAALRAWRNRALEAADKAVNTIEDARGDASEWRAYRKALRDMPQQSADPRQWQKPQAPA